MARRAAAAPPRPAPAQAPAKRARRAGPPPPRAATPPRITVVEGWKEEVVEEEEWEVSEGAAPVAPAGAEEPAQEPPKVRRVGAAGLPSAGSSCSCGGGGCLLPAPGRCCLPPSAVRNPRVRLSRPLPPAQAVAVGSLGEWEAQLALAGDRPTVVAFSAYWPAECLLSQVCAGWAGGCGWSGPGQVAGGGCVGCSGVATRPAGWCRGQHQPPLRPHDWPTACPLPSSQPLIDALLGRLGGGATLLTVRLPLDWAGWAAPPGTRGNVAQAGLAGQRCSLPAAATCCLPAPALPPLAARWTWTTRRRWRRPATWTPSPASR